MAKGTRYTSEFKAKAVRLLTESRSSYSSESKAIEQVATFQWVSWWNSKRLHQSLGYRTPEAVETEYYTNQAAQAASL